MGQPAKREQTERGIKKSRSHKGFPELLVAGENRKSRNDTPFPGWSRSPGTHQARGPKFILLLEDPLKDKLTLFGLVPESRLP